MSKLWVFGDSFSVVHTDDPSPDQWHVSLAAKLGYELKDCSLWGACQDWVFAYIESVQENISPEDQVIAGITQGLLRVSVGLESTADVIADFQQVLATL